MTAALIVAAGRGYRIGDETPKQYLLLHGQTILARTLSAFRDTPCISEIRVVIHRDDAELYQTATQELATSKLGPPIIGGATRAQSVLAGLEALARADAAPDRVLIHDAARPFVSPHLIARIDAELSAATGAFAAVPVVDALWQTADGQAKAPVARDGLWRAQTPQGFHFAPILAAHRAGAADAADDVAIARAAGLDVRIVLGSDDNFKITTPDDFSRAERQIADID